MVVLFIVSRFIFCIKSNEQHQVIGLRMRFFRAQFTLQVQGRVILPNSSRRHRFHRSHLLFHHHFLQFGHQYLPEKSDHLFRV